MPGQVYTQYSGYPAGFADRLAPGAPGAHGLIGTAFEGHYPFEIVGPVDIEISQTVVGTPGEVYTFSGWAHFEGGYAGGVEFLDLLSPNQRNQDAQAANPGVPVAALTDTIFALEFLDGLGVVLPGSILWELHDDGGQQNDNEQDGRTWLVAVVAETRAAKATRRSLQILRFRVDLGAPICVGVASLQVLHEDHFVVLLVVNELVDLGSHHQESEAAGAKAHLLANPKVLDRVFV